MQRLSTIVALGLLACGSQQKSAAHWREAPTEKYPRTIDKWTAEDEANYIPRACNNVIGPDGAFRCPVFTRIGFQPETCVDTFTQMRQTLRDDAQVMSYRLIIAGLDQATSCEEVDITFKLAVGMLQVERAKNKAQ